MSVKDYLLSQHRQSGANVFSINEKLSHSLIALSCLAYLLQFNNLDMLNDNNLPLAQYAAEYWIAHVQSGGNEWTNTQLKLVTTLFQPQHTTPFISWVRLLDIDHPWQSLRGKNFNIPSTIYYASLSGLLPVVQALLENGAEVNAREGEYGSALQAASYKGNEAIVGLLLEKGADVNLQGGHFGNALRAASSEGHGAIVSMLLEMGADVNVQGGVWECSSGCIIDGP
jgi:hypothetical protein